ncbi:MAG: hypothetical protein QXS19_08275 [Candidatus Methanomethylicia archaeon]
MFSLTNAPKYLINLYKSNDYTNKRGYMNIIMDSLLFYAFDNVEKKSLNLKDLRTINMLMNIYNMLSFLNDDTYKDILLKTNNDINSKGVVYRDFMSYIQLKKWRVKNDFELISDKVNYKFDLEAKYRYKFNFFSKNTIYKSILYGYLNYIFLIGEESYGIDQDSGYYSNYSMSDFMSNFHDFLVRYIDNVILRSKYASKLDSLGDVLFSIYELISLYLEDTDNIKLAFYYPINMDSIDSYSEEYYDEDYDEEYDEEYDEDSYEDEEYTSIDVNVNSSLNFVLERDTRDFIVNYDSDIYVTVYKNDTDAYDGVPIGFSINVAKHKRLLKIRFVVNFYLDTTYDEFEVKKMTKKYDRKLIKKIKLEDSSKRINKYDITFYKEVDLNDISNKKYIKVVKEIDSHIDKILDGKMLIGDNNNIVS